MKRVIIAVVIMAVVLALAIYSVLNLKRVQGDMLRMLDDISRAAREQNSEEAKNKCADLEDYWKAERIRLARFFRHVHLDEVTWGAARLSALAEYGETAELLSETAKLRTVVEEIYRSELPIWDNIL